MSGILAGGLFYRGIRVIPSGLAAVLTYLEPVVATAVGAFWFHESLGPAGLVGAALVVGGGLYLVFEPQAGGGQASSAPETKLSPSLAR